MTTAATADDHAAAERAGYTPLEARVRARGGRATRGLGLVVGRLASIVAGVWRRALDGNASDPRAIGYRDRYRNMAERAWEIVRRIDPAA